MQANKINWKEGGMVLIGGSKGVPPGLRKWISRKLKFILDSRCGTYADR